MKHTLKTILNKPSDYKRCLSCNHINYFNRTICVHCYKDSFYSESEEDFIEFIYEEFPSERLEEVSSQKKLEEIILNV